MSIDLHTHSTASDGTVPPADLMAAAPAAGVSVIALTDHDSTGGWDEAATALPPGLTLVPGAEISCRYPVPVAGGGTTRVAVHLLALLFDRAEPAFAAARESLRVSRSSRGRRIVGRLQQAGYDVDWARVRALAAGAPVGRPHLARALVEIGAVRDVPEAFVRLLESTGPYYEPKADLDAVHAIEMVRAAGGVPVLAHPFAHRRGPCVDRAAVAVMRDAGLLGIEVDHPDHDPTARADAAAIAGTLGLIGTGSSDYHGTNKPTALGIETTAPAAYHRIVDAAGGARPITAIACRP